MIRLVPGLVAGWTDRRTVRPTDRPKDTSFCRDARTQNFHNFHTEIAANRKIKEKKEQKRNKRKKKKKFATKHVKRLNAVIVGF